MPCKQGVRKIKDLPEKLIFSGPLKYKAEVLSTEQKLVPFSETCCLS